MKRNEIKELAKKIKGSVNYPEVINGSWDDWGECRGISFASDANLWDLLFAEMEKELMEREIELTEIELLTDAISEEINELYREELAEEFRKEQEKKYSEDE